MAKIHNFQNFEAISVINSNISETVRVTELLQETKDRKMFRMTFCTQ